MRIDVIWTPLELEGVQLQDRVVTVIDVQRAGTSVAVALHNGARAVVPAESTEEALRIARSLGRSEAILCGERQGVRIDGFDLGNSPAEFSPERVRDRVLVMTTTNGTRSLLAAAAARRTFMASFVNMRAVVQAMAEIDADPLIVCAGRQGSVSVDDALCAGTMVADYLVRQDVDESSLDDGALAALALARQIGPVTEDFLRTTRAGRALENVGHGDDIGFCARVDSVPVVPLFRDRQIRRLGETTQERETGREVW